MINKKGKQREFIEACLYILILVIIPTRITKISSSLALFVFVKSNNGRLEEKDTD